MFLFSRLELGSRVMKNTEAQRNSPAGPASNNEEPSSDGRANNGLDSGRERGTYDKVFTKTWYVFKGIETDAQVFAVISSISASIDYVLYVSKETKAKAYITDNFGRSCCKTNEEINIRLMADKSSLQLELNNVIQKLGQKVRRIISYKINKLYNC